MAARGKVVLFGKTGDGKSTVANVLVTGGIEDLRFTIGHGVKGCTSAMQTLEGRGWTVTDTVGLGEGDNGQVSTEAAEQMIMEFLKKVRGKYSHVIYVKSSANRFDVMDETMWKSFQRIFKGAEEAFTALFTKGDEDWLAENWERLPGWVAQLGRNNVFITDITSHFGEEGERVTKQKTQNGVGTETREGASRITLNAEEGNTLHLR